MRIDLPTCNLKTCGHCFDGNCIDRNAYDRCEYALTVYGKDIVPVVRCKDCKYYQKVYGGVPLGEVGHCICHSFETVPDWFCADGERR